MTAHIARRRQQLATSKVKITRWRCPYEDSFGRCKGEISNLKRHLDQCHPNLTQGEKTQLNIMAKQERKAQLCKLTSENENFNGRKLKTQTPWKSLHTVYRICPNCLKEQRRLDNHLHKYHHMKRGTPEFIKIFKKSKVIYKKNVHISEINVNLDILLTQFVTYLQDMAGGSQTESRAKSASNMVKSVITEMIRGKCFTINDLSLLNTIGESGGEGGALFRLQRLNNLSNDILFNYSLAVQKFLTFLVIKQLTGWASDISLYQRYIEKISKALDKRRKNDDVQCKANQWSKTLPESLVNKYFKSSTCKQATSLLQSQALDSSSFCKARNHLLLQLCLLGAKRGGDLVNMTVKEVSQAEIRPDGYNLVYFKDHKHKAQRLCYVKFRNAQLEAINKYIRNIRPFANPKINKVFTTQDGKALEESSPFVQKAWENFYCELQKPLPHITATIVRYITKTSIRRGGDRSGEKHHHLADYLAHNLETADAYYNGEHGIHSAEVGSDIIVSSFNITEADLAVLCKSLPIHF